jgi:hypothetical protein
VKSRWTAALLTASLVANAALAVLVWRGSLVGSARADVTAAGEELAPYMATQQHYAHKLGLAVQSKNKPLAEFYIEELAEGFEVIEKKFPTYDNYPIAALVKSVFNPAKPALAKALAASDWPAAGVAYSGIVNACNTCHTATKHEFVRIAVPASNPFNQSFAPK